MRLLKRDCRRGLAALTVSVAVAAGSVAPAAAADQMLGDILSVTAERSEGRGSLDVVVTYSCDQGHITEVLWVTLSRTRGLRTNTAVGADPQNYPCTGEPITQTVAVPAGFRAGQATARIRLDFCTPALGCVEEESVTEDFRIRVVR